MNKVVNLAGYARRRGCGAAAVRKAIADGRIVSAPVPPIAPLFAPTLLEMIGKARGDHAFLRAAELLRDAWRVEMDARFANAWPLGDPLLEKNKFDALAIMVTLRVIDEALQRMPVAQRPS